MTLDTQESVSDIFTKYDDSNGNGPDTDRAAQEITDIIQRDGNHTTSGTIAKVFTGRKCATLDIEWTLEKFWGNIAREAAPTLIKIYNKLVEDCHTVKNKFEFNDMDNHCWFIPSETEKVFIHTCQNYNHLFILGGIAEENNRYGRYHIRRYWDDLTLPIGDKLSAKWYKQDNARFLKRVTKYGRQAALVEHNLNDYSDCLLKNQYPHKPNLDYFIKSNFKPKFGDGRDDGYIMTYDRMKNSVDWAIGQHGRLKGLFECYIPSIEACLFED